MGKVLGKLLIIRAKEGVSRMDKIHYI